MVFISVVSLLKKELTTVIIKIAAVKENIIFFIKPNLRSSVLKILSFHLNNWLYLSLKLIAMSNKEAFIQAIKNGYTFKGESVKIGAAVLDGEVVPDAGIYLPLKTLNRHGLIAGATGTGKTKTLQVISEFFPEVAKLQADFLQQSMTIMSAQTKEFFDLSGQIMKQTFETMNAAATKSMDQMKKAS